MDLLTIPKRGRPKKIINELDVAKIPKEVKKIGRPKQIKVLEPVLYEANRGRPKLPEELKVKRDKSETQKKYYEENKDIYLALMSCECCKKSFAKVNQYRHYRSKMHLRNSNNENI